MTRDTRIDLIAMVLSVGVLIAVSVTSAHCQAVPDAPKPQRTVNIQSNAHVPTAPTDWHDLPPRRSRSRHWVARHPLLTGVLIGGGVGAVVAIVTHHSCASSYDGHPYDGTPPCPK